MASLEFDRDVDTLYVRLRRGKVASSEAPIDNMVVDLDSRKSVIGLELLLPPTMKKEIKAQLARTP